MATAGTTRPTLMLFVLSLVVLAGLFSTVHNRDLSSVVEYRSTTGLDRYDQTVQRWIDGGFFRHGGMLFLPPEQAQAYWPEQLPSQMPSGALIAYKHGTASYVIPIYVLQRIYLAVTGHLSTRLTLVYNQLSLALVAVALGFLAFRLSASIGLASFHSFALAASCLISFQTFGAVLYSYWEASVLIFPLLFGLILLVRELGRWEHALTRKELIIRCVLAFMVAFGEPATGLLFLLSYLTVRALTSVRGVSTTDVMALFIVPAILVAAYMQAQELLVRANHPIVYFAGTGLLSRLGLDGSTQWYKDHWDLLLRGHLVNLNSSLAPLSEWPALMLAGACATIYLLTRYILDPPIREPLRMLFSAAGFYFPLAFIFSQGVYIHPYLYDVSLVVSCLLAVFCLLPAYVETRYNLAGLAVLVTVIGAATFALTQLRTYAVVFPPPPLAITCDQKGVSIGGRFEKQDTHVYVAVLPELKEVSDSPESPTRSPFLLCEDGKVIGKPHTLHDQIRQKGMGGFSHWGATLLFSSSDNSDPNNNGRSYKLIDPAVK